MKATLLSRAAPALLLTTILAGGVGVTAFAQTAPATTAPATSSQAGNTSPGAATSNGATKAAPATTSATHQSSAAQRQANSAPRKPGESMQSLVERRITDLHSKLRITTEQQSQWGQFAQVMRDNAKEIDAAYAQRAEKLGSMSAVDNMQSYAQIEQTRAQDVQKLVPAFQSLYGSLSDAQKKEADQLFRNYAENSQQQRKQSSAAR